MVQKYNEKYNHLIRSCQQTLLEKSAALAISLPRTLISECGHCKFLKPQVKISSSLWVFSLIAYGLSVLFSLVPFSAVNQTSSFTVYDISGLDKSVTSCLFCGLVSVLGTILFFLLLAYKY